MLQQESMLKSVWWCGECVHQAVRVGTLLLEGDI